MELLSFFIPREKRHLVRRWVWLCAVRCNDEREEESLFYFYKLIGDNFGSEAKTVDDEER